MRFPLVQIVMRNRRQFRLIELVHVIEAAECDKSKNARKAQKVPVGGFHIDDDARHHMGEQTKPERCAIAIKRSQKR